MPANMIETNAHESAQGVDIGALPDPNVPGDPNRITRRQFIKMSGAASAILLAGELSACAPATAPATKAATPTEAERRKKIVEGWNKGILNIESWIVESQMPGLVDSTVGHIPGIDKNWKDFIPAVVFSVQSPTNQSLLVDFVIVADSNLRPGLPFQLNEDYQGIDRDHISSIIINAKPTELNKADQPHPFIEIKLKDPVSQSNFPVKADQVASIVMRDPDDPSRFVEIDPSEYAKSSDDLRNKSQAQAMLAKWSTPTPKPEVKLVPTVTATPSPTPTRAPIPAILTSQNRNVIVESSISYENTPQIDYSLELDQVYAGILANLGIKFESVNNASNLARLFWGSIFLTHHLQQGGSIDILDINTWDKRFSDWLSKFNSNSLRNPVIKLVTLDDIQNQASEQQAADQEADTQRARRKLLGLNPNEVKNVVVPIKPTKINLAEIHGFRRVASADMSSRPIVTFLTPEGIGYSYKGGIISIYGPAGARIPSWINDWYDKNKGTPDADKRMGILLNNQVAPLGGLNLLPLVDKCAAEWAGCRVRPQTLGEIGQVQAKANMVVLNLGRDPYANGALIDLKVPLWWQALPEAQNMKNAASAQDWGAYADASKPYTYYNVSYHPTGA